MVLDVKIGLKALFLRRQGGATENEAPLTEEAEESEEGERHEAEVTERTSVRPSKGSAPVLPFKPFPPPTRVQTLCLHVNAARCLRCLQRSTRH